MVAPQIIPPFRNTVVDHSDEALIIISIEASGEHEANITIGISTVLFGEAVASSLVINVVAMAMDGANLAECMGTWVAFFTRGTWTRSW